MFEGPLSKSARFAPKPILLQTLNRARIKTGSSL
jgi:hypothetical protein